MEDLTLAPVRALIDLCAELDPPLQVSMDPADLNLPAGWLALDEVRPTRLAGTLELRTSLFLVAPDIDPERALSQLAPLVNQLGQAGVRPDGPVTTIGVVMPGDSTALQALRFPLFLTT